MVTERLQYGLIGSTEFGEDYPGWIQHHVVAYLNTDIAAAGSILSMRASPSLSDLLVGVVQQVGQPLGDKKHNFTVEDVRDLGSGSGDCLARGARNFAHRSADFTVFLQNLGIASSDAGYTRGKGDPVYHYHSVCVECRPRPPRLTLFRSFDSQYWMEDFGDVGFAHHANMAKARLSNALRSHSLSLGRSSA
jgi:N-acetylated-alpha-linked acidic dipeptidase